MKKWGVVLLIVGILLLVAGFGSGWLVEEALGAVEELGMESIGDVGGSIMQVYENADVISALGGAGVAAGVLMLVLGRKKA